MGCNYFMTTSKHLELRCTLGKDLNHPRQIVSYFCIRDYSNASRNYQRWRIGWTNRRWIRQGQYKSLTREISDRRKESTLLFQKRSWLGCQKTSSTFVSTSSIWGPGSHFSYATTMMREGEWSFRQSHANFSAGVVKARAFASPCVKNLICFCIVASGGF